MNVDVDLEKILKKVVGDVFEQMYFMFPEEVDVSEAAGVQGKECLEARVGFKSGDMGLVISGAVPLVQEMAANMFGSENIPSYEDVVDVIREAANIIAGNVINEWGASESLTPDIPAVEKITGLAKLQSGPALCLNFDGELFLANIYGSPE